MPAIPKHAANSNPLSPLLTIRAPTGTAEIARVVGSLEAATLAWRLWAYRGPPRSLGARGGVFTRRGLPDTLPGQRPKEGSGRTWGGDDGSSGLETKSGQRFRRSR